MPSISLAARKASLIASRFMTGSLSGASSPITTVQIEPMIDCDLSDQSVNCNKVRTMIREAKELPQLTSAGRVIVGILKEIIAIKG